MTVNTTVAAAFVILLIGISVGWSTNGIYRNSVEHVKSVQLDKIIKLNRELEKNMASTLERRLSEINANVNTIRTIEREIVTRPVYTNVCVDDAGLRLIKKYASGKSDPAEPTDPVP